MYVPNHFREDDTAALQQYLRDYSFGLLIVADANGIDANHVPFLFQPGASGAGILQCHLARSNPVWQRIVPESPVLAVFQGPDAYVSPSWYPSKAATGKVVPTWNYLAVHVDGRARIVQEPDWLDQHLRDLTNKHEAGRPAPWSVDDAPADYIERLKSAIVGVEIAIDRMTGKLKASQNQPDANRAGVKSGLHNDGDTRSQQMSALIR